VYSRWRGWFLEAALLRTKGGVGLVGSGMEHVVLSATAGRGVMKIECFSRAGMAFDMFIHRVEGDRAHHVVLAVGVFAYLD
jgi:hypothetical protein